MDVDNVLVPGNIPAIMTVAPNSPKARENPSTDPANTPRPASGRLIVKNTLIGDAPRVAAICSYLESTCSKPLRAARTKSGHPITTIARMTAFHVNPRSIPNRSSHSPINPRRPNSRSKISPVATGGSTSGSDTSVSTTVRPGNDLRAKSQAKTIPGGSITIVAIVAIPMLKTTTLSKSGFIAPHHSTR